jgi:hypothetical protein
MFARGATEGKVKTWSYHEDEEDFTKGKPTEINKNKKLGWNFFPSRCYSIGYMGS